MYAEPSFKTKKALKEAVASGKEVTVFSPGPFPAPSNGKTCIEGPNYVMHTWYAEVELQNGVIIKVK